MLTSRRSFDSLTSERMPRLTSAAAPAHAGKQCHRSRRRKLAFALAASLVMSAAGAASILDFDRWMSQVEKRALSLQNSLDRGDADTAVADAREIERLYRNIETYFALSGNADSAVELSKKGWRDAADIAARTATKDTDGARVLIKGLMEDCRTCHRDYKPLT